MKKTEISLLICAFFTAVFMCGCKFNLTNTKYLNRPDVRIHEGYFEIVAPYISNNTESITIYRQNVHESTESEIERVAILFPKGSDNPDDQTFYYEDERVLSEGEYRYYLRFKDTNGSRNRTEWTEKVKLERGGASNNSQLAYSVNDLRYEYDADTMIMKLPSGSDFSAPPATIITDIAAYKPALVFQTGDIIQVFEVDDTKNVNLKALLPEEFLYKDVYLLGVLGQKTENNSQDENVKKCISWTKLAPVTVKTPLDGIIRLEPEYGKQGADYSTTSDNEN